LYRHHKTVITAFVLLFFITISTTYASGSSLPGDLLYPIKTNIAEPFIKLTISGKKAKHDFDLILADTRINELEQLIKKNATTEENVAANFKFFEQHIKESEHDAPEETYPEDTTILEETPTQKDDTRNNASPQRTHKLNTQKAVHDTKDYQDKVEEYRNLVLSVPELSNLYEKKIKNEFPAKDYSQHHRDTEEKQPHTRTEDTHDTQRRDKRDNETTDSTE
jgi:hypothetical protein